MKTGKFLNTPHGIFVLTTKSATLALLLFIYRLDKRILMMVMTGLWLLPKKMTNAVFCGVMSITATGVNCSK